MRLFSRRDSVLVVGFSIAITVVFSRQISHLLDFAREVEQNYGLSLIPGLIILTVVFVVHQQGKWQESKAEAVAAAATAQEANARSHDLELLVTFGHALARSLDLETIRDVLMLHLPQLLSGPDCWVLIRTGGVWSDLLATHTNVAATDAARETAADRAVSLQRSPREEREGMEVDDQICFPMIAGGSPIGVLGFPKVAALSESRRNMLAAASALLSIALKNAQLFRDTRENSLRDGLTGCFNRSHGIEMAENELRRARRSRSPLSIIMFDIDHFKSINDRYGHLCGDMVLSTVGRRMRNVLRGSDIKCRYGGEEFLVLLPETTLDGARQVADTLRREIGENALTWNDAILSVTASFGITAAETDEVDTPVVIARADAALYRAKSEGRNCIRVASDPVRVS